MLEFEHVNQVKQIQEKLTGTAQQLSLEKADKHETKSDADGGFELVVRLKLCASLFPSKATFYSPKRQCNFFEHFRMTVQTYLVTACG